MFDEAEFGVDDISEEEYNRLKEKNMPKKKKKGKNKKAKSKRVNHVRASLKLLVLLAFCIPCTHCTLFVLGGRVQKRVNKC